MSDSMIPAAASRRHALRAGLAAFAGGAFAVPGLASAAMIYPTPRETEGPFWVDEKLNRRDIRYDSATGAYQAGFPLGVTIRVYKLASGRATALRGAMVDVWHANAAGNYSDEPAGQGNANTLGTDWLRGYQLTNSSGIARFGTNFPGWYTGRTPHVHVRVRTFTKTTTTLNFTTQMFFPQSIINTITAKKPYRTGTVTNATDNVYNTVTASSGSTRADPDGEHLMTTINTAGTYATGNFTVYIA